MNSKIVKIAFLASRNLAVRIINYVFAEQKKLNYEIVGGVAPNYITWWDDQVNDTYKKLGIDIYNNIDELIHETNPDVIFSINYWKLISQENINKIPLGIVNVHHSYKLRFRGRYSTSWAIVKAREDNYWKHGTTLHYISEKLDDGNIIDTRSCDITEEDTAETLFVKVEELAYSMFKDNLKKIIVGVDNYIAPDPIYYFYDSKSNQNMQVNKDLSLEYIYDIVRAWSFKNRQKPYFLYKDKKITLSIE